MREALTRYLSLIDLKIIWYDLFEESFVANHPNAGVGEGVIELLEQVKRHRREADFNRVILAHRPDLRDILTNPNPRNFAPPLTQLVPKAVILTALGVECKAVFAHLANTQEVVHPTGTIYNQGEFRRRDGSTWSVAVAQIGPGNAGAAVEAQRAIDFFNPKTIFFVGIAGGIKDVKLGDVVVATRVYGYEAGRQDAKQFYARPDVGQADYNLVQRARADANSDNWLKRLTDPTNPPPQVLVKPIAAGERVVADIRAETVRFLHQHYNDAIAVEMEGRGFLVATQQNPKVSAIVIRGISDLLSDRSQTDQIIASRNAAAFAFEVLANLVIQ